jgi:hypothetical protein
VKTFTAETSGVIQFSADEVEEAFFVANELQTFVFEFFVAWTNAVIEVHFVAQARTAATRNRYPNGHIATSIVTGKQGFYFFGGVGTDAYHGLELQQKYTLACK